MVFRKAAATELDAVLSLYRSVIGEKFCVWNEKYPGAGEIRHDFETDNLFVITENEKIIGAASIVPENEMDEFECWSYKSNACEIARIVVDKSRRGKSLSAFMVNKLTEILKARGCDSIRLSAAADNIPAIKTYRKAGFECAGEADMYANHYLLFEKSI